MRWFALGLTLILSAFPARAQSGDGSQSSATTAASPLDGNWRIIGNLDRRVYPAISMSIHVNGKQVSGLGTSKDVCSNRTGEYTAEFRVTGTIEPDGSFSLRTAPIPSYAPQFTFVGKVPVAGATAWDGSYTLKTVPQAAGQPCIIDHKSAFTASPLASLKGAFLGQVMRMSPFPIPQGTSTDLINRTPTHLKLSIGVKQGGVLLEESNPSRPYWYLPLAGIIRFEGCPCFAEGKAIAGSESRIEGEMVRMKFEMDDQSELYFQATYSSPNAGLVFNASVTSGRCHGLGFSGTLNPE